MSYQDFLCIFTHFYGLSPKSRAGRFLYCSSISLSCDKTEKLTLHFFVLQYVRISQGFNV